MSRTHRSPRVKFLLAGIAAPTLLLGAIGAVPALAAPADASGLWSATTDLSGQALPFQLQLKQSGGELSGHFFDGDRPNTPSTSGSIQDGKVHLEFPSYLASLDGEIKDGTLTAEFKAPGHVYAITAHKAAQTAAANPAPDIAGEWIIPYSSPKGEKAWRLIVQENPATGKTAATILRIDGDTGTLSGSYKDGVFHLSHFAGERPFILDLKKGDEGTLALSLTDGSGTKTLSAIPSAAATAKGLLPDDPGTHTTVKNPDEPLRFSFNDLNGNLVSNTDPRFAGKVVLVNITGSWCPNCHDEAPFLQSLYARHRTQGLEIVALDFEQADQLADPKRLRAFIARYGLGYTVLLGGQPKEVNDKLPQAVGLNAWPTTFIIGRDGKVRGAHVGFTSPGSGARDAEARAEIEKTVSDLLAEAAPAAR